MIASMPLLDANGLAPLPKTKYWPMTLLPTSDGWLGIRPVTQARTWMLTEGWLRHGRLSVHEVPVTA